MSCSEVPYATEGAKPVEMVGSKLLIHLRAVLALVTKYVFALVVCPSGPGR